VDHCGLDVRPAVVGYVTALWQEQPAQAEAIIRDLQLAVTARGGSPYDITLEVLDAMADLVLTIIGGYSRMLGIDRDEFIGQALAEFGRIASEEE
jgi:hypothetical protein